MLKAIIKSKTQQESIKNLSSKYYDVNIAIYEEPSGKRYFATGNIKRKDSSEFLNKEFRSSAQSIPEVFDNVYTKIHSCISRLTKPVDWGSPEDLRTIVNKQVSFEKAAKNSLIHVKNKLANRNFSEELFYSFIKSDNNEQFEHTKFMCNKLNSIPEERLIELFSSRRIPLYRIDEEEDGDRDIAICSLYNYLFQPSDKLINAYNDFIENMETKYQ